MVEELFNKLFSALIKHFQSIPDNAAGAEVCAQVVLQSIDDGVLSRAFAAAKQSETEDEPVPRTGLQQLVRRVAEQFFVEHQLARTLIDVRAAAFGRVVADAVHRGIEDRAVIAAKRTLAVRFPSIEENAIEREREIERNRHKPQPKALYPV